jgi:hypothetical protein
MGVSMEFGATVQYAYESDTHFEPHILQSLNVSIKMQPL